MPPARNSELRVHPSSFLSMPTYDYVCDACGHKFELFQTINEAHKRKCPECKKQKLRRLFGTGVAIMFKGSGFYQTDYRSDNYKKQAAAEKSSSEGKSSDSGSSDGKSSDSKSTESKASESKVAPVESKSSGSSEGKSAKSKSKK